MYVIFTIIIALNSIKQSKIHKLILKFYKNYNSAQKFILNLELFVSILFLQAIYLTHSKSINLKVSLI